MLHNKHHNILNNIKYYNLPHNINHHIPNNMKITSNQKKSRSNNYWRKVMIIKKSFKMTSLLIVLYFLMT